MTWYTGKAKAARSTLLLCILTLSSSCQEKNAKMKDSLPIIQLTQLLTEDETLKKEVLLAVDKPSEFVNQFRQPLLERGIEEPIDQLPWLALVHGLSHRNLLYELDWKESPEEVVGVALTLLENHGNYQEISSSLNNIEPFIDEDIEEFLPQLNRKLESFKVQLIWLDIDSDSYPLTIIPLPDLDAAKQLAREAGYGKIKS